MRPPIKRLLVANGAELCYTCHAKTKEALKSKDVHPPFAGGECTGCHNPHGSNFLGMLKDRMDTVCYGCHSDAENKFKKNFIHKPVLDNNCAGCHKSHGSEQKKLLKAAVPQLCTPCHADLMKAGNYGD